jgi:hypothetical protein
VLTRLKTHRILFGSGVDVVLSEEVIKHFTKIELEMRDHQEQRQQSKIIMDGRFIGEIGSTFLQSIYKPLI